MFSIFLENGNELNRGALENYELEVKFYMSFVRPAHLYILPSLLPHGLFHMIHDHSYRRSGQTASFPSYR